MVGGELRLARNEALPIRTDFDADPIRALTGAPVGLGRDEYACVQILARPVTGRRVQRARRSARRVHTDGSTRLVGRVLDLITPGVKTGPARHTRTRSGALHSDPQTSLEYAAQNRAIVTKQRGSQYETVIRYAVATLLPQDAAENEIRTARDVARGRAHALAASFASFTEHNHYTRHRLRHPGRDIGAVLADRRLGTGDLLSVANWRRWRTSRPTRPSPASNAPEPARSPRHPASPPPDVRPSRSVSPTPATNALSPYASRTRGTTCTSSAPPAPANPRCWAP